jgi:hypothetical protein
MDSPRKRPLRTGFVAVAAALVLLASLAEAAAPDWSKWVLKIEVVRLDGTREIGSGVTIGPQRVVTNCHVLREAGNIRVSRGGGSWLAHMDAGDEYRDLCFLRVPGFDGEVPQIAEPEAARVGIPVVAVGYSGGNFGVSEGHLKGLFSCACDGGKVLQTSASFEPGASGGGMFDRKGNLLGILTFKSGAGGNYHFAVPVGWMKQLSRLPSISGKASFWESATRDSGYFLVACDLGARKDWRRLLDLAQDWTRLEPDNPQAWMAWGRAHLNLGHAEDAAHGFQKVLLLDSTHAEAMWELQKLELELDRPLTGLGG